MKRKAKYKIIQSMIDLLDEYPFEDITIKMICAYSGVNRSTFYDNYKDKYDLLEKIQNYHLSKYTKLLTALYNNFESVRVDTSKLYKFFLIVAKYIKRKESFYRAIFITYPNKGLAFDYFQATKKHMNMLLMIIQIQFVISLYLSLTQLVVKWVLYFIGYVMAAKNHQKKLLKIY